MVYVSCCGELVNVCFVCYLVLYLIIWLYLIIVFIEVKNLKGVELGGKLFLFEILVKLLVIDISEVILVLFVVIGFKIIKR